MTMHVNASHNTILAVGQALGRARLFDDRLGGSDQGRIAAWAEAVEPHQVSVQDMLQAVTDYYSEQSGKAMQVADLIRIARRIRGERGQREADDLAEARRLELDAKAAPEEVRAVVVDFVAGQAKKRTRRLESAEDALQTCQGKQESIAAIREFFTAKKEAMGKR